MKDVHKSTEVRLEILTNGIWNVLNRVRVPPGENKIREDAWIDLAKIQSRWQSNYEAFAASEMRIVNG